MASLNKDILLAKHDQVNEDRLLHDPRNAKYTSHMIQNNIIAIMATLVREKYLVPFTKQVFTPY